MSRIFLSHSSSDNFAAVAVRDWLVSSGWDDIFLDLDPAHGISAGERWERRLYEAANRCEAVLFLISRSWLSSEWCLREYDLAIKLNKRIFGLMIEDIPVSDLPARVSGTWQLTNLAHGEDHRPFRIVLPSGMEGYVTFSSGALRGLKAGLEKAGLDPRFFGWPPETDPGRAPYRGMLPLEAEDAGIFFGREAQIITALDQLRGLSDAAPPRFMAILGASGAGKSSFLRAGLLPRLQRDDTRFLPLPPIRPERHVLFGVSGLMNAIENAFRTHGQACSRAELRDAIRKGAPAVLTVLSRLLDNAAPLVAQRAAQGQHDRTLVLSIDQGEELFNAAGQEEAQPFLALLRELLLANELKLIVLMTIRSDAFERLQSEPALVEAPTMPFNLPPLPRGAYQAVIEGPALRLKDSDRPLVIEPALTSELLRDIEDGGTKDALPLLAFTLERLYLEHGGDGDLRLSEYRHLGGIKGSIEAAVEQVLKAADRNDAIPRDRNARLLLLRQALIPWLAGIDPDTLSPRRLVARMSEIPAETRPLVDLMVEERLLATDRSSETGEVTVEPAHEALLRQWGLLDGWLKQDLAVLSSLEALRRASRDWAANNRQRAWLVHAGARLEEAATLLTRSDIAARLEPTDRAYLQAAKAAAAELRDRELEEARRYAEAQRQIATRTRIGMVAAAVLTVVVAMSAFYAFSSADEARRQAGIAEAHATRAQEQTELARSEASRAEQSLQRETAARQETQAELHRAQVAESLYLAQKSQDARADGRYSEALAIALKGLPKEIAEDKTSRPLVPEAITALSETFMEDNRIAVIGDPEIGATSPDGRYLVTISDDIVRVWDTENWAIVGQPLIHEGTVSSTSFSKDSSRLLTSSLDGTARIWDVFRGIQIGKSMSSPERMIGATFSPDESRIVTWSLVNIVTDTAEGLVVIWDASSNEQIGQAIKHDHHFLKVEYSPDGTRILAATTDGNVGLYEGTTGRQIGETVVYDASVDALHFSPDGARYLIAAKSEAQLFDTRTGLRIAETMRHDDWISSAVFSPDGTRILTASLDTNARLWDAATGVGVGEIMRHAGPVQEAFFSQDGRRLVTTTEISDERDVRGAVRFWDGQTGLPLSAPMDGAGSIQSASLSQDGELLLITRNLSRQATLWNVDGKRIDENISADGNLRSAHFLKSKNKIVLSSDQVSIWNVRFRHLRHEGTVHTAILSHDGMTALTASADGTARLWDRNTGVPIGTPLQHPDGVEVQTARFSPDDALVLTAASDGFARLWDMRSQLRTGPEIRDDSSLSDAVFSPDGQRILTSTYENDVKLWNARSGELLANIQLGDILQDVAFSPDGTRMVAASFDGTLHLNDALTGKTVRAFTYSSGVDIATFSPDASRLAVATLDGSLRILNTQDGQQIGEIVHHTDRIATAIFSFDSTKILTASEDGMLKLLDSDTGKPSDISIKYDDHTDGAIFSPDGEKILVAATRDIQVFSAQTGLLVKTLRGRSGPTEMSFAPGRAQILLAGHVDQEIWDVSQGAVLASHRTTSFPKSLIFSPDGSTILAAWDDRARLWDAPVPTAVLLPVALASQTRDLSDAEREKLHFDAPTQKLTVDLSDLATDCDRLASHPYDREALAPGLYLSDIKADEAIAACKSAIQENPREPRLHYLYGRALLQNKKLSEAKSEFEIAADSGYAMALYNLAIHLQRDPSQTEKIRTYLTQGLEKGAFITGGTLGMMHWNGKGGPVDAAKAVAIWQKAAALGDPTSHKWLAWVAESGRGGFSRDLPKAFYHYAVSVKLLEQAGDANDVTEVRYRRASLARTLPPETVAEKWREALSFRAGVRD